MRISDLSSYVCSSDLFVDAGEARQLHAVEIVLEDDIDGARDRIRAIYGCAADRDGFDPIHQAGRNQVEIHLRTRRSVAALRGRIGRHPAAPVDKRQCPLVAATDTAAETLHGQT